MTASALLTPTLADPTVRFRRRAAAVALPAAFACQLVTNTMYALAADGGPGDTGTAAEGLAFFAAHPQEVLIASWFALVGCLLAVVGLPAALRVLRPARPRLALIAVAVMAAGYVAYFALVFTGFDTLALAVAGVEAGPALDAGSGAGLPVALAFIVGNLLGTLLLGLALILGGRRVGVPATAGFLVSAWTVGHVVNIIVTNEWFAVAGGALEVAGLVLVAAAAWRVPDQEWARRG